MNKQNLTTSLGLKSISININLKFETIMQILRKFRATPLPPTCLKAIIYFDFGRRRELLICFLSDENAITTVISAILQMAPIKRCSKVEIEFPVQVLPGARQLLPRFQISLKCLSMETENRKRNF